MYERLESATTSGRHKLAFTPDIAEGLERLGRYFEANPAVEVKAVRRDVISVYAASAPNPPPMSARLGFEVQKVL